MVSVGGATRLTDSGLSITEWKPVVGTIPPLTQEAWLSEFEKYKAIPEYKLVNYGMSLDEFKEIYWWEWGHRFLGRLIGMAFLLPLLGFAIMGRIVGPLRWQLPALFVLGGLQGALGWYMVKSGLSDRIDVSQYRLAAHLGLAVLLFALMAMLAFHLRGLDISKKAASVLSEPSTGASGLSTGNLSIIGPLLLVVGVFIQMILGAFVAGLRAGRAYNTWPLMDDKFVPDYYFPDGPSIAAMFESVAAVQFNHRIGAYILLAAAAAYAWQVRKTPLNFPAIALFLGMLGQAALGIVTLLKGTPLWLGLFHQAGALLVLLIALYGLHRFLHLRPHQ